MSQITTHVLDTAKGKPAQGISLGLYKRDLEKWVLIGAGETNPDGRVGDLLSDSYPLEAGEYRISFDTHQYYKQQETPVFYPHVEISFCIQQDQLDEHFHIPLLLSPFGYSTYRGS